MEKHRLYCESCGKYHVFYDDEHKICEECGCESFLKYDWKSEQKTSD